MSTIHASAVLVGPKTALIRGPSGSGKSQLVWDLIQAAGRGALPFARLVADDRAHVEAAAGQALKDIDPADDAYASAWYRARVTPVHIRRALLGE